MKDVVDDRSFWKCHDAGDRPCRLDTSVDDDG